MHYADLFHTLVSHRSISFCPSFLRASYSFHGVSQISNSFTTFHHWSHSTTSYLNPQPNTIQPRILIQHGHFHFTMHTNILLYVSATNAPFGYSISMDYYNSIHLYLYFIIIMISTVNDPLKRINTLLFLRVFFAHHPQHPFQPPFFQQTIINHSKWGGIFIIFPDVARTIRSITDRANSSFLCPKLANRINFTPSTLSASLNFP